MVVVEGPLHIRGALTVSEDATQPGVDLVLAVERLIKELNGVKSRLRAAEKEIVELKKK